MVWAEPSDCRSSPPGAIGEEAKLCRTGGGRQRQTPAGCPARSL